MPSLFRRRSAELAEPSTGADSPTDTDPSAEADNHSKRRTPSKRELGQVTPKRVSANRRQGNEPPPANRREAYRRMRERQRAERAEASEGMRRGDEQYLLPRDRGPEKALTRDVVDSRRTAGTWFFGGALVVLVGTVGTPPAVQLAAYLLWLTVALAWVVDSVLICRRVKRLVRQRYPKSTVKMRSLYFYAVLRGGMFRRLRVPLPRVDIGSSI